MAYPDNFDQCAFERMSGEGSNRRQEPSAEQDRKTYQHAIDVLESAKSKLEDASPIETGGTDLETPKDAAAAVDELVDRMEVSMDRLAEDDDSRGRRLG